MSEVAHKYAGTPAHLEDYHLPPYVAAVLGYRTVPIGDAIVSTRDTAIYCEDLLTPPSHHEVLVRNGVDVFSVSIAFQQSVGKTAALLEGMQQSARKSGGVVVYANQKGCDGDRFYYGGKATVLINGTVAAQVPQFSLKDVEVAVAIVSLGQVRCYRDDVVRSHSKISIGPSYRRVKIDFDLSKPKNSLNSNGNRCHHTRQLLQTNSIEEELVLGPACWLWDMLRRSRAAGFLCPLSGGIDSYSTATLVYGMCRFVMVRSQKATSRS